jgi:DNA-binding LacI/PurR family transcriptional regulator
MSAMGRDHHPGSITMEDVAREAGVSRALVSIVFRDAPGASDRTRSHIRSVATRLGYRPDQRARQLGRKRTKLIGVTFGAPQPFHGDLLDAMYHAAEGTGYDLHVSAVSARHHERTAIESLMDHRCESLILLGPTLPTAELDALGHSVRTVVVARQLRSAAVSQVRTDDTLGARLATDHLLGLGHTAIALSDGAALPGAAQRRRGYRESLAAAGLSERVQLIPGGQHEIDGERAALTTMSDARRHTAIVAFNDLCAIGLMNALRLRGVAVPDEVSLVGYDDIGAASLRAVNLTTVRQDTELLAQKAVERAIPMPESDGAPGVDIVAPRLVVRSTTAVPQ